MDFQFDVTTDGRPIKIVSIIDEHTRECLGGMVERSITGDHLIGELDRLAAQRGTFPAVLRCDNGPELACGAMADWASGHVALHFISPGEPWRNGYVESFNSRIRDDHGGVVGTNDNPAPSGNGGWFESEQGEGVRGWSKNPNHAGVVGVTRAGLTPAGACVARGGAWPDPCPRRLGGRSAPVECHGGTGGKCTFER